MQRKHRELDRLAAVLVSQRGECSPECFVWRVEGQVADMTCVHTSKPFQLHSTGVRVSNRPSVQESLASPQVFLCVCTKQHQPQLSCPLDPYLVRESAVLVAGLHELAPDLVKALVVLLQQPPMRLPHIIPLPPQICYHLNIKAAVRVTEEHRDLGCRPCARIKGKLAPVVLTHAVRQASNAPKLLNMCS